MLQGVGAVVACAEDLAESPFALQGLLEAFDLPVSLWPAGSDEAMLDRAALEQLLSDDGS